MKILIVDNSDPADKQYNDPLIRVISRLVDHDTVNYMDVHPDGKSISGYDGVILSGVPLHYDFESLDRSLIYSRWIRTTNVPVLGICLGHEVIGKLFGASLLRDKEAENGTYTMKVVCDDPIFKNVPPSFKAKTLHRASITLPDEFKLLASSKKCVNVISRHKEKDIYGFQFHPEGSPLGEIFFSNFIAIAEKHRTVAKK